MKIILTLILLIFACQISFGQEKLKAVLFDETGIVDCCPPTFDMFYSELVQTNSDGIVVIYRNKNKPLESYYFENGVKSIFDLRKSHEKQNEVNIQIVQGKSGNSTFAQFWKIPKGANRPDIETETWDYSLPIFDKAFILHGESDIDGICPSFYEKEILLKILQTNQNLKLNVVIYSPKARDYRLQVNKIKQLIRQRGNINLNRIQFYSRPKTDYKNVEFWLIPKKNSN